MANTFDPLKPTLWSKVYQENIRRNNIARTITSAQEQKNLTYGKEVSRPYISDPVIGDLVFGDPTYTPGDLVATEEKLLVNKWIQSSFNITKDQMKQVLRQPAVIADKVKASAWQLGREIDRNVFGQYSSSAYNTTAAAYTKTDIYDGLGEAHRTLRDGGVEQDRPWYAVVDASVTQLIQNSQSARETMMGDKEQKMGFGFNRDFAGFRVFESSQALTWTGSFKFAVNPSEGDTITIDGVVFTFNATPSGAGSVDIGASAAATIDNLVTLINAPLTTTATGIALSAADAAKFLLGSSVLISAADGTTTLDLTSRKGRITLATDMAGSGNGIQNAVLHCPVGRYGAIDTVFQSDMETEVKDVNRSLSMDYITDLLWGVKMFNEGANRSADFKVTTQADALAA